MSYRNAALVGYSGHGCVVGEAAILQGFELKYYLNKTELQLNPYKLQYLGFEGSKEFQCWNIEFDCVLAIGDNSIRRRTAELLLSRNKVLLNVVHPKAAISKYFVQGMGNYIGANVTVNPFVNVGNYCILNTGCIIEHDCVIGDSVHIAPGAVLAGGVVVGNNSFVGANSVIKEGTIIGENVTIGAGSVVLRNVENNKRIVGNPGRML
ncbi:acetyltransferase [uncultured Christiangramia sp.]|uniref:acetyltransferase n=1 Tax=Christiangramia sp. 3-2217-3z TaxID=3417564 RepID=UPI0026025706|nr:acetyltransferase [uncultured Christiangramia sp.]